MSRAWIVGGLVLVAVVLGVVLTRPSPAQGPAAPRDEFEGKTVAINHEIAGMHTSGVLKNVSVKRLGGRDFLSGEYVLDDDVVQKDWRGVVLLIPLEKVESLMLFQDADAARRVAESTRRAAEAK